MKTVWEKLTEKEIKDVHKVAEEYRVFLSKSKTERTFVDNTIQLLEDAGFHEFEKGEELKVGDRVYFNNRGKNICAFVIGKKPIAEGMNVLGAHIDSPRLDIKQNPLYESDGLALLDTHYYGGIKKYQWVARPMSLVGVVCKKDGTKVEVNFGEDPDDPVVGVSDLLVHLAQTQLQKPAAVAVEGEKLDVLVGSMPTKKKGKEKNKVKQNILDILKKKYDISEADFASAELEVVPSGEAKNYGLDNSMLLGYGHDDKVCGYMSLKALVDTKKPNRTACCILVDKEEIGSYGNTGMQSRFFEDAVAQLLASEGVTDYTEINACFRNSKMLSSDVCVAYDPNYPEVSDKKNSAYFGCGICFCKFTGSRGKAGASDANAEFVAKVRNVMDKNKVSFRMCELSKVDVGGGGTIAHILAALDMDVLDAGICVQNMHAPFEVVSKADVYEGYRAYKAFLKDME